MTDNVKPWPKVAGRVDVLPPLIAMRPCDWGLIMCVNNLETQLGSIEAYNRLATAAHKLKAKIDNGEARSQNPLYAIDIRGATSVGVKQ